MDFLVCDDTPTDDVRMSIQILGRRMDERIIGNGDQSGGFCNRCKCRNSHDIEQGIAGGFDPDAFGFRSDGFTNLL